MQKWLSDLKLAIIEEDVARISLLLDSSFQSEDVEELKQALSLMSEANKLILDKKHKLATEMQKLQCAREYANHA